MLWREQFLESGKPQIHRATQSEKEKVRERETEARATNFKLHLLGEDNLFI